MPGNRVQNYEHLFVYSVVGTHPTICWGAGKEPLSYPLGGKPAPSLAGVCGTGLHNTPRLWKIVGAERKLFRLPFPSLFLPKGISGITWPYQMKNSRNKDVRQFICLTESQSASIALNNNFFRHFTRMLVHYILNIGALYVWLIHPVKTCKLNLVYGERNVLIMLCNLCWKLHFIVYKAPRASCL